MPRPCRAALQVLMVMVGSLQQLHGQSTSALEHLQHRWTSSRRTSAAGGPPTGGNAAASLPAGANTFSHRTSEAIDTMLAQAQDSCSRAVDQVGGAACCRAGCLLCLMAASSAAQRSACDALALHLWRAPGVPHDSCTCGVHLVYHMAAALVACTWCTT